MNDFALTPEHIVPGARLYADRRDMVRNLEIHLGATICEIGVEFGNFSEFLIETLRPSEFWAFDLFDLHQSPLEKHKIAFSGTTHEQYYRNRFASRELSLRVVAGDSSSNLRERPAEVFDLVYVDGDHRLEGVRRDAEQAERTVKRGGVLIFNDYTLYDPYAKMPYGVVPIVNEMCILGGWRVVGFALQSSMFCDIALRRAP